MQNSFDFGTLFVVCLISACVCLGLAIIFFFVFDIPSVYLIRSGKGAKRTIKKMEEINASSGRLRKDIVEIRKEEEQPQENMTPKSLKRTGKTGEIKKQQAPPVPPSDNQTSYLGYDNTIVDRKNDTMLLNNTESGLAEQVNVVEYQRKTKGKFTITYQLELIHSDEIIQ